MKQLAAIAFSLLLIAAQTFAVPAPVGSGAAVAKSGCCCGDCQGCQCCLHESSGPVAPPVEATAPPVAQNQFVLPPAAASFILPAPAEEYSTASVHAEFRTASLPVFQRNCAFLI